MATEEQQVPETQATEDKTDGEDRVRGQTPEAVDEPKDTSEEEPPEEKDPEPEPEPEPEPKPLKPESAKVEEKKEEAPQKEEAKRAEPPKREEPRKEEPRKQDARTPFPRQEPRREQHHKRTDIRGRATEKEEPGDSKKTVGGAKTDAKSVQDKSESSEGRTRQKVEFFKEELKRLQENLKRESSKITPPSRRKHKPFIFNTLEPYYNTHTTKFLIDTPDESEHMSGYTFSSRSTAQGLIDPWINLRMDQEVLPQIGLSSRPVTRSEIKSRGKLKSRKGAEANRKEGSTRLPKFPVVALETKDLVSKQLYYSDVPNLRKELKNKYSAQARSRVEEDYKRTQQDFYRMDLDRLDQVPPGNRQHMTSTYMAYLQNTPGSRRALNDCVRTLHGSAAH